MKLNILIGVISFIMLLGCSSLLEFPDLTLRKKDYTGNQLKTNGFYYTTYESYDYKLKKKKLFYNIYFLYKNGVILNGKGQPSLDNIKVHNSVYSYQISWGIFQIDGNRIRYEKWIPTLSSAIYEGVILNDTTFTITEAYNLKLGNKVNISKMNDIYHFQAHSPKPDSTNNYIK